MVVEDNDFNLLTINTILINKFGIRPDEATNGQIAVEKFKAAMDKKCRCKNRAYKLIFMDIQMPIMDGFDATDHILSECNKAYKKIVNLSKTVQERDMSSFCNIIALTAYTSKDIEERCYHLGMKQVIPKPIDFKQMKEII